MMIPITVTDHGYMLELFKLHVFFECLDKYRLVLAKRQHSTFLLLPTTQHDTQSGTESPLSNPHQIPGLF